MRRNNRTSLAIITSWGPALGAGHVQRMAGLAAYLREADLCDVTIVSGQSPSPGLPAGLFSREIPSSTSLILRDMRDSAPVDIDTLRRIAPVVVLDDLGEGADSADMRVFLLPHPDTGLKDCLDTENYFLYGYNFSRSLGRIQSPVEKDIDLAVYCSADDEDYYMSLLPGNISVAFLRGGDSFLLKEGLRTSLRDVSAGEVLLRSHALLSHFGISLYEGKLAGCRLFTLNPSEYHRALSLHMASYLDLCDLGLSRGCDPDRVRRILTSAVANGGERCPDVRSIIGIVERNRHNFWGILRRV